MRYKIDKTKQIDSILEDGHTMFPVDIVTRLNRLAFLEKWKDNNIKTLP